MTVPDEDDSPRHGQEQSPSRRKRNRGSQSPVPIQSQPRTSTVATRVKEEGTLHTSANPSDVSTSEEDLSKDSDGDLEAKIPRGEERVSIYLQVFTEMLETVLEHESFLFNEEELDMFARFGTMSYAARYLFVRLFARKNGWFRSNRLENYADEIGKDNIQKAIDELCGLAGTACKTSSPSASTSTTVFPDINAVEAQDNGARVDPLSHRSLAEINKDVQDFGLSRFAVNETILARNNNIDELLSLLSLDELKALGKDLKVSVATKTTREALMKEIKFRAGNQSTLTSMFAVKAAKVAAMAKSMVKDRKGKRRHLESSPSIASTVVARQTEVVISKILKHLGHCVKLESGPIRLFARLHLIYYRSVAYSDKTLTQAVLARFKIRNYPKYEIKRSFNIFASRSELIEYEEALVMERQMEEYLGESLESWRPAVRRTREDREELMHKGLQLFETVYPKWEKLVAESQAADKHAMKLIKTEDGELREPPDDRTTYYRKRFLAGWPMTRVVYKGCTILAKLQHHEREVKVLESLLAQTAFRRGKRGEWYDRLALVLMNHIPGDKENNRRKALQVCKEALAHPWTHLVYHSALQRRLLRLKKLLDTPEADRQFPFHKLKVATRRSIKGEKLSGSDDYYGMGATGKKSIWRSCTGAEVTVEELCLEFYNKEGWKGFHSENGILTTIFALLFWDVIFAPVDGVFETAYQSGPLDLSTDAFAIVRADLVQRRLQSILNGESADLLRLADERERETKTWCVGVRWSYERADLLEIVECLGAEALHAICRVYAEEWSHRTGGVPDLLLWNRERMQCKFVEVKGPGDTVRETQKVWVDLLLSAGVTVELCDVCPIYEEDYLSMSDTDRKRLYLDGKRKKRKSATPSVKTQAASPGMSRAASASGRSAPVWCIDSDSDDAAQQQTKRKKGKLQRSDDSTFDGEVENVDPTTRDVSRRPPKYASKKPNRKSKQQEYNKTSDTSEIIVLSD